ncbi:MAG: MAPEG family protein [Pseudomonadota bacterium]
MSEGVLIYPMLAHILLVFALYGLLTLVRAPAVWGVGAREDGSNPWQALEPRVSANLSNQFEWPVLFYVACVLAMLQGQAGSSLILWLAWLFVIGRVVHSAVQVFTTNIRLRGLVFTINFLAVLAMWLCLVVPGTSG